MKKRSVFLITIISLFSLSIANCSGSNSSRNNFTVTWKNYDGTILEIDENVLTNTMPSYDGENPTRDSTQNYNYIFSGWSPEITPVVSDITYIAQFDDVLTSAYVSFDLNGGRTINSSSQSRYMSSINAENFFFDVIKDDYNFRGWEYSGKKIFDGKGNKINNVEMAERMTFKALFAQTAYLTIVTNMPEAGTVIGEGEYPYNTNVDISAYAKQGYVFVGWYYQNVLLSNTNEYKYKMWNDDVDIEARFKLDSFLMNVHTNNQEYGLVLLQSPLRSNYLPEYQEYRDYTAEVTIAAYSRTNVRFLGWYDTNNELVETNAVYNFVMPSHDYTLEAKWNYFTIDYELNGGENNPSNPTSYTVESEAMTLNNPTRTGYDFIGWKYKGNFVTKIDPSWIDNIELIAAWRVYSYSIVYNLNGGTNSLDNPNSYTIESETITLSDPIRAGYTFEGWYDTNEYINQVTHIDHGNYGDIALYAKWTIITYSITYNLNGGIQNPSNPSIYTVEDSITFAPPTRTGYTFLGWFDENDNRIASIAAGTTGALTITAHWNEGDSYTITLDPNGGSLLETSLSVQYDHTYSLPALTRTGYTFDGWYDGSILIPSIGTWNYTSNKAFVAHWTIIEYEINYNLNDGSNASTNPSTYTVESVFTFASPSKTGYTFLGWYDENNNKITSIAAGTTGTLTLEARWSSNLNNLSVTSEDTSKGTVTIISGSGYTDESITVNAAPAVHCIFRGWYNGNTKVSYETTYTFTMPANNYSLVAHFMTEEEWDMSHGVIPAISDDGKTITYGLYPQTNVDNSSLISSLNNLTTPESNGWYLYEDEYYAKVSATPCANFYGSNPPFDNGVTIVNGATYWFKCEPIVWNVLSNNNGEYYLLSSALLDACDYYVSAANRTIDGKIIYSNNYKYSTIREWLNDGFYHSAFALDSGYIQTTIVDNSISTIDNHNEEYSDICENTQDKIFLPSYQDYINDSYGFSTSESDFNGTRICNPTDWARAKGVECYNGALDGCYWTRSSRSGYDHSYAWFIYDGGQLESGYVDSDSKMGVRPAITFKVS